MAGLRERQKADRTSRILDAATRLFRETGYGAVRIEDIAQAAEVSVGTLYNYFTNKGDLLLAIVLMEVEEVLAAGKAVVDNPPRNVAEAFATLIGIYFDHSLHYLSKEMWRTAMAISIEAPATPFSVRYTELDALLSRQVCDLVRRMQVLGFARAGVDAEAVGQLVFNNLNQMFTEFVKQEDMPIEILHARTARQNAPVAAFLTGQGAGA